MSTRNRPFARLLRLAILAALPAVALGAMLATGNLTSRAVQNASISLDMITTGNSYDEATNSMTVGTINNCLTTAAPGNNLQHNHTTHLIIQNVEDLIAWQVRFNYLGDQMRPSTFSATPFTDGTTGDAIGFVNLPIDSTSGQHRGVIPASNIPAAAPGPQTALIGAVYNGAHDFPISPDTPAKVPAEVPPPNYSTTGGGILATLTLSVLAGNAGNPSLFMNLDDGSPNPPESGYTYFNGFGTTTVATPVTQLGDGYHGEGAPCVAQDCVTQECPPVQETPTPPPTPPVTPTPPPQTPTPTPAHTPSPTPLPTPTAIPMPAPFGVLFGTDASGGNLITIDPTTGAGTLVGFMNAGVVPALAIDPVTGIMYAGQGGGSPNIYTVNPSTGAAALVGSTGLGLAAVGGLDFRSDGSLFAAVNIAGDGVTGSDHLALIDKETRQATVIGPFGTCTGVTIPSFGGGSCTIEGIEGLAFTRSGSLVGSLGGRGTGSPGLYAIDTTTGAATFIAPILDASGAPASGGVVSLQSGCDDILYGGTARAVDPATDGGRLITIDRASGLFSFVGAVSATGGSSLGALALRCPPTTPTPSPTPTPPPPTPTPTPTPTPPPFGQFHDAAVKRLRGPSSVRLSPGVPDSGTVTVVAGNAQSDHADVVGIYLALLPPGGTSNFGGCSPAGVLNLGAITLLPGDYVTLKTQPGWQCANPGAVDGMSWTLKAVADVHGDDFASCSTLSQMFSGECAAALASDDSDDFNSSSTRPRPVVVATGP